MKTNLRKLSVSALLVMAMLLSVFAVTPLTVSATGDPVTVDSVSATVTEPVIGESPSFDISVGGEGYTAEASYYSYWNDEDEVYEQIRSGDDYKFEGGMEYSLWIYFYPADGYEFADDVTVTINGETVQADNYRIQIACYVNYFILPEGATHITSVKISDVTEPVIGATPDFDITLTGNGVVFNESPEWPAIVWYRYDQETHEWELLDEDTPFDTGFYNLAVYLKSEDGYTFTEDTKFYFGEEELPGWSDSYESYYDWWKLGGSVDIILFFDLGEGSPTDPTYTVSFDANGGSGSMEDATGISGQYTLPECTFTAPEGKRFKCWIVDGIEKAVGDQITVTADTTVTAQWRDVGILISAINITGITKPIAGEKATTSGITLNTEYISIRANHWLKAETSSHMVDATYEAGKTYPLLIYYTVADGYEIADDVVITHDLPGAVVTIDDQRIRLNYTVESYTVTFNANGGSGSMADVTGIYGQYTLPECIFTAPEGKRFKCWIVDGIEKAVGDKITVTADTTLTVQWRDAGIPISAINITGITKPIAGQLPDISGITTDTTGISLGDIIWCTPESQNMIGRLKFEEGKTYTFCAYYTVDDEYELLSGAALTHDLDGGFNAKIVPSMQFIEIKYTVSAAPTYTVSFDADGGSGTMADVPVIYGEYILPECTFTPPAGKQFKAWSLGGIEKAVGDKITVTADTTVTAVWEDAKILINTIRVTGITAPVDRAYPVTTGITTDTPGLTITYAQWNRDIYAQTAPFEAGYTYRLSIYFEVAEGYEISDSVTVEHDLPDGEPGRKSLEDDSPWISIDYTIPGNLTYTVSFDANGGSGTMLDKTDRFGAYNLPECSFTAPEGHEFKCWSVNGEEKAVGIEIDITADTTVKAIWKAKAYTITFDTAGGSSISAITQEYGTAIAAPANPTKDGYTFTGWDQTIPSTMPAENITITATWEMNHTHIDAGGEWESDGTYHWHTCSCSHEFDKAECSGGTATCTEKAVCSVCNNKYGTTATHNHGAEWKKDADNHWNECTCGDKANTAPHADEDSNGACDICGQTMTVPHTHDYGTTWKSDGTNHWKECSCGDKKDEAAHSGGTATCKAKATCSICNADYGALAEHQYSEATCTKKAKCSVCGDEKGELAAHTYVDGKCTCGATDPNYVPPHEHTFVEGKCECGETDPNYVPPHEHTFVEGKCECGETDPNYVPPEEPKDGLSGGAIAAIVIGSVAVAGIGGFAIFWFVVKKKSWLDLIKVFKK